jgi:hypothetical protein
MCWLHHSSHQKKAMALRIFAKALRGSGRSIVGTEFVATSATIQREFLWEALVLAIFPTILGQKIGKLQVMGPEVVRVASTNANKRSQAFWRKWLNATTTHNL